MSFGVPAGAMTANHELNSKPGRPDSDTVGTSGNCGRRARRRDADQPQLAAANQRGRPSPGPGTPPAPRRAATPIAACVAPLYGTCVSVMPAVRREQRHRDVLRAAVAARAVVDLAGARLGRGDQVGGGLCRARRCSATSPHSTVATSETGSKSLQDVPRHLRVQVGQHGHDAVVEAADRVAVGRRLRHALGADQAGGAGLVLDDDLLAHVCRHPLRHDARRVVDGARGGERHDHADRLVRIGRLRRRATAAASDASASATAAPRICHGHRASGREGRGRPVADSEPRDAELVGEPVERLRAAPAASGMPSRACCDALGVALLARQPDALDARACARCAQVAHQRVDAPLERLRRRRTRRGRSRRSPGRCWSRAVVVVEVDHVLAHRRAVQRAGEQADDQRQAVALVAADRQQEAFLGALRVGERLALRGRSSSPRASSRRAAPWP